MRVMWLDFGKYSNDWVDILIMALFPYLFWISERLAQLIVDGQADRIPRWLRWIPWSDPHFRKTMGRGVTSSGHKWMLFVLGIGLILPTVYLVRGPAEQSLGHRMVIVLASVVLFLLAVALLEWLVRPRESKEQ